MSRSDETFAEFSKAYADALDAIAGSHSKAISNLSERMDLLQKSINSLMRSKGVGSLEYEPVQEKEKSLLYKQLEQLKNS